MTTKVGHDNHKAQKDKPNAQSDILKNYSQHECNENSPILSSSRVFLRIKRKRDEKSLDQLLIQSDTAPAKKPKTMEGMTEMLQKVFIHEERYIFRKAV